MRKHFAMLAIVLGVLATMVGPAAAISGNFVEDFEHPFVGLVVFYDENGEFSHRCSGALLTPTIFLTAGHCTEGVGTARVYFQQDAGANFNPQTGVDPTTGYPLTCAGGTEGTLCATSDQLYNYGFADFLGAPNIKDVGLVILDQPINLPEYGVLAVAGSLDGLGTQRGRQDITFTVTGYGVSKTNPVQTVSLRERLMAESKLVNLGSNLTDGFNLQLSSNPGDGKGGTCFGDSGGPIFYGGFSSNTIVGVNSFVLNQNCRGVGFAYRTDTTAVIDWIHGIVGDAEFSKIQFVTL